MNESPAPTEQVFRKSWVSVWFFALLSLVLWFFVACFLILALQAVRPLNHWYFNKVYGVASWLVAALGSFVSAYQCWRWSRSIAKSWIILDAAGVRFRLPKYSDDTMLAGSEVRVPWEDIQAVTHFRTSNRAHVYIVNTQGGGRFPFTRVAFPRPERAALAIATRIGKSIDELK